MCLWKITIRGVSFQRDRRKPFVWYVATISDNEVDAVKVIRQHHTQEWWDEHLIQDVEGVGELVEIEGIKPNSFVGEA